MNLKGTRVEREIHDEPPSLAVVSAVADVTDTDPTEFEPLYSTIDPDALDALFRTSSADHWRRRGTVTFTLEDCEVVVHGDRKVIVKPPKATRTTERAGN